MVLASLLLTVTSLNPAVPPRPAHAENNGLATTPLMGWSSWSFLKDQVNEANVQRQAKALHDSGLQALGYQYVKIDDWYYLDPTQHTDGYGRWLTNPERFPHGLAGVAAYVHSLGLKFGLYMTPGIPVAAYAQNTPIEGTPYHARDIVPDTTAFEVNFAYGDRSMYRIDYRKPGSQAFISSWANLLASWGVDALKIDAVGDGTIDDVKAWSQALRQTGHDVYFELSSPYAGTLSVANGDIWRTYSNGWRTDGDIDCCRKGAYPLTRWDNIVSRFLEVPPYVPLAGPGGWNDLDALELGNGKDDGLTLTERETMGDAWALFGSPLVLGADLTALDPADYRLIADPDVIAIDQSGHPAHPVSQASGNPHANQQVWAARNDDGSYTVGFFNLGDASAAVAVKWADDLGFARPASVSAVRQGRILGRYGMGFSAPVAAHGSLLLRVVPDDVGTTYNLVAANLVPAPLEAAPTTDCDVCPDGQNAPPARDQSEPGVFASVAVPVAGTYQVDIDYASPDAERRANISVNGAPARAYRFPATRPATAASPASPLRIALALGAGRSTIRFTNPQARLPDLHAITVSAVPIDAVIGDQPPLATGADPIVPLEVPAVTPEVGGPSNPDASPQ